MDVIRCKNLGPKLRLATLHEIACLLLEHGVLIGDRDELFVTESFRIRDVREVWIPGLTEFANYEWFIELRDNIVSQPEYVKF